MVYADTDFFLALFKPRDWLKPRAARYLATHRNAAKVTPFVLTELLLLASEFRLDPQRLMVDVLQIAELREASPVIFLLAATFMTEQAVTPLDALHAAVCAIDNEAILSSDAVYDRLGVERVKLGY